MQSWTGFHVCKTGLELSQWLTFFRNNKDAIQEGHLYFQSQQRVFKLLSYHCWIYLHLIICATWHNMMHACSFDRHRMRCVRLSDRSAVIGQWSVNRPTRVTRPIYRHIYTPFLWQAAAVHSCKVCCSTGVIWGANELGWHRFSSSEQWKYPPPFSFRWHYVFCIYYQDLVIKQLVWSSDFIKLQIQLHCRRWTITSSFSYRVSLWLS